MRAQARQAGEPGARQERTKPGWFVAGVVVLVFAIAYLILSIMQATGRDRGGLVSSVVQPAAVVRPVIGTVEAPPTEATPENPTPAPIPRPGLAAAVPDAALAKALTEAVGDDAEHIAVSVKRISDGRSASLNGDFQFYAASTFKLAVLYETELRHYLGEISYDDALFISDEDAAEDLGTSGYLEFKDDGSITVEHLLEAMIEVSDNSSAVTLMHKFGGSKIDATLRGLGLLTMTVNQVELWTTADDLTRLMEAIYVGEGLGEEERTHMRQLLLAQSIRNGIPGALANDVAEGLNIGNKTGTWPGAQHDVAFVEEQSGAYVISVLTDGSWEGWLALERVVQSVHRVFAEGA